VANNNDGRADRKDNEKEKNVDPDNGSINSDVPDNLGEDGGVTVDDSKPNNGMRISVLGDSNHTGDDGEDNIDEVTKVEIKLTSAVDNSNNLNKTEENYKNGHDAVNGVVLTKQASKKDLSIDVSQA